jgi:chromosome partitioning protein
MGKIIAISNHKGGVGKTTTTAALGEALAQRGKNVLLVDLDAQANLTGMFLSDEAIDKLNRTIYETLTQGGSLPIIQVHNNLSICPSSLDLAGADIELLDRKGREKILTTLLEPIREGYDFILIDCAPSLGILPTNAFFAADEVYITLTAEALPLQGLTKLEEVIDAVHAANGRTILGGILITRFNNRKLNKQVEEAIRARYGAKVFATRIRENIAVAEAPNYGMDIITYDPESNGAKDYMAVAEEILERYENK